MKEKDYTLAGFPGAIYVALAAPDETPTHLICQTHSLEEIGIFAGDVCLFMGFHPKERGSPPSPVVQREREFPGKSQKCFLEKEDFDRFQKIIIIKAPRSSQYSIPSPRKKQSPKHPPKKPRQWTDADYLDVLLLREEGHTLREIGARYDLSGERIRWVIAKANSKIRFNRSLKGRISALAIGLATAEIRVTRAWEDAPHEENL